MDSLIKDIRYAVRSLIKRPGFVAIAVITLALGIGANTAIFSLVNTVLLRSLPVDRPNEIVSVAVRGKDDSMSAFSWPNYKDFRDRNEVLSGLLVYRFVPLSLSRGGVNERIWGYEVSGNYFDVLNVKAIHGRTFLPEEDKTPNTHPVIVLGYDSWQRRFGGDPSLVGKDILINNHQFRVIGIAPPGFKGTEFVYSPEIWLPVAMVEWAEPGANWLDSRSNRNLFGVQTNARGSSAMLKYLPSLQMPTMRSICPVALPKLKRFPTASALDCSSGIRRRTNVSFTTATCSDFSSSCGVNSRPCRIVVLIVLK